MATSSLLHLFSCSCYHFSSIHCLNPKKPTNSLSSASSSSINVCNSTDFSKRGRKEGFQYLIRTSSEGITSEFAAEDPKFVPLDPEDPIYGPPALLLMGFEANEMEKIQKFLKELDGEFLKIAKSLPRICFLSGLSGEEMMMFIDAFPETGLKPAVFAALVPNSADKLLIEVAEEIMGDHEMMSAKQAS